jgi:flap endonuclease-1
MGINLSDVVSSRPVAIEELRGRWVAIDAYNAIYQFLSVIRQPDGTPLKDSRGRVTSHLSGLLSRNANLIEQGVRPCYVFDGVPSRLKTATLVERSERRLKAEEEWKKAAEAGDVERAYSKAQQSSRITSDIVSTSRLLLAYMGIPVVQAAGEGEAQAAHMCIKGDVWAASSQDYDSLLFGAPRLLKNLSLSGRRKMPGRNEYRDIGIELIESDAMLSELQVTRAQLIDAAVLVGTDFNEGIRGIGPKKALKLVREHRDLEAALRSLGKDTSAFLDARAQFTDYERSDAYELLLRPPQVDKVVEMLCHEHDFGEQRVLAALEKMRAEEAKGRQARLDMF